MKKLCVFGGTSGLGQGVIKILDGEDDYIITSLSSKDCDITDFNNLLQKKHLHEHHHILVMSNYNSDGKIGSSSNEIEEQIDVNIIGALNVASYFIRQNKADNIPRKIIFMSSFLSTHPVKGAGVYSAGKAFIDNLVKTIAIENGNRILCNSIQAGFFNAGLTDKLPPKIKEALPSRIPVGRLGQVEELAHAIKFLFENDYVTGTNLVIDGGVGLV